MKYNFYYKDAVQMNGKGLIKAEKIVEAEVDSTIADLVYHLGQEFPEFYDCECSLYINADFSGVYIDIDYSIEPENLQEMFDWLRKHTEIIKMENGGSNEN